MKHYIKNCIVTSVTLLVLLVLLATSSFAAPYTDRLEQVWRTDLFLSQLWTPQSLQQLFADAGFYISQDDAAHIIELETTGDLDGSHTYTANMVSMSLRSGAIGGVGGGDEPVAYICAAGRASRLVFHNLIIPSAKTRMEKRYDSERKTSDNERTFGTPVSWEKINFDNRDEQGDLYSATVGMAWDDDNISYGFMLPYNYLNFDSFEANSIGVIGFGQYNMDLSEVLSTSLTAHANYTYTDLNFDDDDKDVNMYGGGLSGAITLDQDLYVVSTGISYLYNTDDTGLDDDEQHLIKLGVNAGIRSGDSAIVDIYCVWTKDITDYAVKPDDDNYFEIGLEGRYSMSDTFSFSAGNKKVIALEDFDADEIYIGSSWKF